MKIKDFFGRGVGGDDIVWEMLDVLTGPRFFAVAIESRYPFPTTIIKIYDRKSVLSSVKNHQIADRGVTYDGQSVMMHVEPEAIITLESSGHCSNDSDLSANCGTVYLMVSRYLDQKYPHWGDHRIGPDGSDLQINYVEIDDISLADEVGCFVKL